jgi:hypothetical protein
MYRAPFFTQPESNIQAVCRIDDCFQADQVRRADHPEEVIEEVEARARMSTLLQRDELLTQSKILEKETSPPAKEADRHPEAESDETNHARIYNRTVVRWHQAMLLISLSAGVLAVTGWKKDERFARAEVLPHRD